jgi:hypothetical protein
MIGRIFFKVMESLKDPAGSHCLKPQRNSPGTPGAHEIPKASPGMRLKPSKGTGFAGYDTLQ